jgi:GNAT superfamily N-acetyltransferase
MAFEVRAATAQDRPAILQLVREMIPAGDAAARFAWLYDGNPAGGALTWIAWEAGKVAGCTSYFPFRLQLDGVAVLAALGGDGYVRPKFRRRGLGRLLHDAARRAMPEHGIGCMYGAPGEMNVTPLKQGGSREVGQVARWARPLRGAALGLRVRPLDRLVRRILRPPFVASLDPMTRGDARVDEIWRGVAGEIRLGAVRDATFYSWRFIDAPARREPAFVIVKRDRPIAACSLEPMNGGENVRIVDLIAVSGAWHAALAAIARHAAETGAKTLDIKLMALDGRRRQMWRSAFVERESKPFLVVIPEGGDERFLDPMRWFYGGADSDMDALE